MIFFFKKNNIYFDNDDVDADDDELVINVISFSNISKQNRKIIDDNFCA